MPSMTDLYSDTEKLLKKPLYELGEEERQAPAGRRLTHAIERLRNQRARIVQAIIDLEVQIEVTDQAIALLESIKAEAKAKKEYA